MTTIRYETEVTQVGAMVPEFLQTGLMILFGEAAPEELHDICVLHRPAVAATAPEPGDLLELDGEWCTVTSVGSVAKENLLLLGHISLKADGAQEAALPGDISVDARSLPLPRPGTVVRFVTGQQAPGPAESAGQPDQQEES
jgi:PTS system glucitol/sorbitol-specific IIA component